MQQFLKSDKSVARSCATSGQWHLGRNHERVNRSYLLPVDAERRFHHALTSLSCVRRVTVMRSTDKQPGLLSQPDPCSSLIYGVIFTLSR